MSILDDLKKQIITPEDTKIYTLAFRSTERTRKELKAIAQALNASQNWIITTLIHEAFKDLKAKGRGDE